MAGSSQVSTPDEGADPQKESCSNNSGVCIKTPLHVPITGEGAVIPATESAPQAVIVYHGMGQQVPFETLGSVADKIADVHTGTGVGGTASVICRYVDFGDRPVPRAELTLTAANDSEGKQSREIHIYEAYWAPLTEGRITLPETVSFLWQTGIDGIQGSWNRDFFRRWMFGGLQELKFGSDRLQSVALGLGVSILLVLTLLCLSVPMRIIAPLWLASWGLIAAVNRTTRYLVFAAWVFASLTVVNGVILAVGASSLLKPDGSGWPRPDQISRLTADLVIGSLLLIVAAVFGLVWPYLARASQPRKQGDDPPCLWKALRWVWRVGITGTLLAVIGTAIAFAARLLGLGLAGPLAPNHRIIEGWFSHSGRGWILAVLWFFLLVLSAWVRQWLLEYLGDVAIYVSSHRSNRFAETRQQIKDAACKLSFAVYGARDAKNTAQLLYSQVVLVAHSLGSVVAYDAYNAVVNQDLLAKSALQVPERTPLFLTFGSPLDKTAFLFRTQLLKVNELREALAAATQPMIVESELRPRKWINIFSPDDWISGSLEYYDDPDPPTENRNVENIEDPFAITPGASHNEYWANPLFRHTLYDSL